MLSSVDIVDLFGEDVLHLHGNLYRVRRDRIRLAKSGLSVEKGKLVYGNPRWFVNKKGELEARGTESSKMEELRCSIQNSGLDNPIRLRPIEGDECYLEVVNGERRFRCITDLCEADDLCHDPSVGDKAHASEVYEWIDCRIEVMDDKTALGIALKTNETSEVIGDLASLYVVRTLRESGHDDQEILRATGKSLSWLRETDRIMGLDEVCLDHFQSDQITRKAAIQLALIENAEERLDLLEKIVQVAQGRRTSKLKSLDKTARKAEEESEIASAAAHLAEKSGDKDESEKLKAKSRKAKEKAGNARKEAGRIASKPAKADARDIKAASGPTPLPHAKIKSEYMDLLEQIISNEGFDDEGDSLGLDLGVLAAVLGVLSAILEGEEDAMSVFSAHCPLPIEEEFETEESETSDEDQEEYDSAEDSSAEDEDDEENEDEDGEDYEGDDAYGESDADDDADETPPELESEFRHQSVSEDDYE